MTPLDHLRSSFVALGVNPQCVIGFALVPALVDGTRAQGTRSERIETLTAWLAQSRLSPRAVGDMVTATDPIKRAFGEVLSLNATVPCIGSQPAQGKRLDHLETAMTRTVAQASALIEQSRREVERSRGLLNNMDASHPVKRHALPLSTG